VARVKSVLGGGNQVKGLKELAAQIKAIGEVVVSRQAYKVIGDSLMVVHDKAKSNVIAANWPHETLDNFFMDARPSKRTEKKITALMGIPKRGRSKPYRPGYVEWKGTKEQRGRTVGMNLATLYEFGGTKTTARPAFRPAVQSERGKMLDILESGLKEIIAGAAKSKAVA